MNPHIITLPRRVVIGRNVLDLLDNTLMELGYRKPLVLCDPNTKAIAGDHIVDFLSGFKPAMGIVKEPSVSESGRIRERHKERDVIIAAGGGSVIDVAKLAAFESGTGFISVPTALSHDGIASAAASLINHKGKGSFTAKPPDAIIADITILMNAPYRMTASGYADVVSNITSVFDWRLSHNDTGEYFSEYSAGLALLSADTAIKSAKSIRNRKERGIRTLVQALLSSGISMSLAQSSRPASGAEHAFSHALDRLGSPALHGEQCGVGSILMAYWQGQDWKRIRSALKNAGAPTTAEELGIDKDVILKAVVEARNIRDRYTILSKKPLDRESAEEICRATGVF